ncbi:calcium uniporter protein, mitochondrial-like isoform X2 [Amphibalanus amphitrite]|uniref:calcium uniporter protein, mitochondrial-like isoform X2 n=1 Tax=Amphibalanus amphitrite TaxID=1232801 RepID=UPI001C902EC4|nr:calcium uniporter protein, mitochondrial-like isoform X2 [Amphibalanus amphitrite]
MSGIQQVCRLLSRQSMTKIAFTGKVSAPLQCVRLLSSQPGGPGALPTEPTVGPPPDQLDTTPVKRSISPSLAEGVEVAYSRGLPQITVPLPSRREKCRFTLKPISNTVGDFIDQLHTEDRGIDRVVLRTLRGTRIATSDSIEALMEEDFELIINDDVYHVKTPELERPSQEELTTLSNVRNLVSQLYEALNVEEHQLKKEREILAKLEDLKVQLAPMEKKKKELEEACHRRTNLQTWLGLGLMGVQFGILARLTWWEYSWDIMEPVTYFVTYGTAMAAYGYFVITKQDYVLPDVKDRSFLLSFYKKSRKSGLDVQAYNELRDSIYRLEQDLRRLRDPLQIHLPPAHLEKPLNTQFSLNSLLSLLKSKPERNDKAT